MRCICGSVSRKVGGRIGPRWIYPAANAAEKTHSVAGSEIAVAASRCALAQVITKAIRSRKTTGRTVGSAGLPELSEVFAELLAGCGPVCADRVAQFGNVALDVELVLLEPGNIELLASSAALELTRNVLFVVSNNSARTQVSRCSIEVLCFFLFLLCDDSSGADTLGTLGDQEHALFLDRFVDVVAFVSTIGDVVVSNIVDLVLLEEFDVDNPGAVFYDFVDPFAVSYCLGAFLSAQHGQTLATVGLLVTSDTDEKMDVGESGLGLLQLAHVSVNS